MATIKSYTDLEQSEVLSKILSLESADIYWDYDVQGHEYKYYPMIMDEQFDDVCIPCWSLAALLDVLPEHNLQRTDWGNKTEYKIVVYVDDDNYASKNYDNPIDACYNLILKLHELNLL